MRLKFEPILATVLYGSRWVMASFYLGLLAALTVIVVEFFRELIRDAAFLGTAGNAEVIVAVLKLIDLVLVGNLVLIMILAGVRILIGRAAEAERVGWMGKLDFSQLGLRLVALLVAIAAVQLLESFVNVGTANGQTVIWQIVILLTFALSGFALAWMERLSTGPTRVRRIGPAAAGGLAGSRRG